MSTKRHILSMLLVVVMIVSLAVCIFADNSEEQSVSAQYGGSIYNAGTMNMTGGKVYGGSAQYGGNIYNTGILNISGLADVFNGIAGAFGHNITNAPGSTFTNDSSALDSSAIFNMHNTCTCGSNAEPHKEGCVNNPKQIWTMWTATDSLPTTAGYYYLTKNVTVSTNQAIKTDGDIYIDLNGKTVTRSSNSTRVFNMIAANTTASLTILDSAGNGKIDLGSTNASGALALISAGNKTFTMYGGTVNGSKLNNENAGVVIRNVGQTVNLYGGRIVGGTTTKQGGAIWSSGALTVDGATVTGGSAAMGGNICIGNGGTLKLSDASLLSGGKATGEGYADCGNLYYENAGLKVGFGKASISPDPDYPVITGTGNAGPVAEDIYAISVYMEDAYGNKYLHVLVDLSHGGINTTKQNGIADDVRKIAAEEFGFDASFVTVGGTHTHSSVDYAQGWSGLENPDENTMKWRYGEFVDGVKASISAAIADCAPATMHVGSTYTENLTFVRRYLTTDSSYPGGYFDGFNKLTATGNPAGLSHESDADEQIQLVKFERENAKPILMVNYQAHATKSDTDGTSFISPDFVGSLRDDLEKDLGVNCVFYQGACGNLAPTSKIAEENYKTDYSNGTPEAAKEYGSLVADVVSAAYGTCFTEVKTGRIQTYQMKTSAASSKVTDAALISKAQEILDYYDSLTSEKQERLADTNRKVVNEGYYTNYGIESYYHAKAIVGNASIQTNYPYEINVISIGDVSLVTLPAELSDVTGMQIKEGSPFKMTLLLGYTCASGRYVMHDAAYENGGYETYTTYFARGTAEIMLEQYITNLNNLYASKY